MTRTADPKRREALRERIVDYACEHGLSALSLRPLAKAVGSSPRVLLYYFGSKDGLVIAAIEGARARQRAQFANIKITAGLSPRELCAMCWRVMGDPRYEPIFRLWFEVYATALQDRSRFPGFLDRAVEDWLDFLTAGSSEPQSREWATMVIAAFRGFLLDVTATRDRKRVDAAVALWLDIIASAPATGADLNNERHAG